MGNTDKLAIFADDMRRLGVVCLPPCLNASEADFTVEAGGDELAVRFALGALKGVGERAMEQLVEERVANGPFASVDDLATRVDPRLLNKRQVESLAGAGGFDSIDLNRAGVFASAETIMAVAARTHDARHSGQGGLFGEGPSAQAAIKLPESARWSIADRMDQEKEAFGFYFSAHPVDRYRHLAKMSGARDYGALGELTMPAEGGRLGATMAALVESASWRTAAKSKRRYLTATLSDASGQFMATCFDDQVAADLEEAARAGGCGLLTVELDARPGEEMPRVTVKRIQPFETIANTARLVLDIEVIDPPALNLLAVLLANARGGRGEVRVALPLPDGGSAEVRLGRDFLLDAELAARIEPLQGIRMAALKTADAPRLVAVG